MPVRTHVKLFFFMTAGWFLFWLIGLPDYYQQYSTRFMIIFDAVVLLPIVLAVYAVIKRSAKTEALLLSFWLAFYITVPLFLYDYLYCGYYLGHGFGFVRAYWYLTVYYVLPWLIFPIIGWQVERARARQHRA